jgi:hypothetical protein
MKREYRLLLLGCIVFLSVGALIIVTERNNHKAEAVPPITVPWATPPDYRIVYLVNDPSVDTTTLSPSRLEAILGTHAVTSWEEVLSLDNVTPIDALIIHNSAISQVDSAWLSQAYRRGVVIAVFDVYASTLAEILDAPGITLDKFASEPYPGDFYIIVSQIEIGSLDNGQANSFSGRSTDEITDSDSLNRFAMSFVTHLDDIKQTREQSKQSPPQTTH